MLKVEGLKKSFLQKRGHNFFERRQRRRVVDGVSFEVGEGEIIGLLGPNGAGKTTSFRMTCGMIEPDAGTVHLDGKDITNWPMYRRAREGGMGYLAQEPSIFRKLTTAQNLLGVMEMLGFSKSVRMERCEELIAQFGLEPVRNQAAMSLSGGQKRRLEIARALVPEPRIILLDEPFAGVDPVTIHDLQDLIHELRERGVSILITDHREVETLEIADRCYVIVRGRVLCNGEPDYVLSHPEAKRHYFGDKNREFGDESDPQYEDEIGAESTDDETAELPAKSKPVISPAHPTLEGPHEPKPAETADKATNRPRPRRKNA